MLSAEFGKKCIFLLQSDSVVDSREKKRLADELLFTIIRIPSALFP